MKVCSPDYLGMDKNEAVEDFLKRIEHYRTHYEAMDCSHDKDLSFIQIFNQGERFLVNKLAGEWIFLPEFSFVKKSKWHWYLKKILYFSLKSNFIRPIQFYYPPKSIFFYLFFSCRVSNCVIWCRTKSEFIIFSLHKNDQFHTSVHVVNCIH